MDRINNEVVEPSEWFVPELVDRSLPGGRRMFNQTVKQAFVARLRQSRGSIEEAARVNGIKVDLLKRWVLGKTLTRKPKASLLPVRLTAPVVARPVQLDCEIVLPKGLLRIKCNVGDLSGVIAQLQ
jgi:transposase-like protein